MKPQPNLTNNLLALLALLLLACCPPHLQAAEAEPQQSATASAAPSEQATRPAPNCPAAHPPTADAQQTQQADTDNEDDLHTLRQRYRHDPTGVRARLGMCRRGQGGGYGPHGGRHGGGQQRRQRWVEPWTAP